MLEHTPSGRLDGRDQRGSPQDAEAIARVRAVVEEFGIELVGPPMKPRVRIP